MKTKLFASLMAMIICLSMCITGISASADTVWKDGTYSVETEKDAANSFYKMIVDVKNGAVESIDFQYWNKTTQVTMASTENVPDPYKTDMVNKLNEIAYYVKEAETTKDVTLIGVYNEPNEGLYEAFQTAWSEILKKATAEESNASKTDMKNGTYKAETTPDDYGRYYKMEVVVEEGTITKFEFTRWSSKGQMTRESAEALGDPYKAGQLAVLDEMDYYVDLAMQGKDISIRPDTVEGADIFDIFKSLWSEIQEQGTGATSSTDNTNPDTGVADNSAILIIIAATMLLLIAMMTKKKISVQG